MQTQLDNFLRIKNKCISRTLIVILLLFTHCHFVGISPAFWVFINRLVKVELSGGGGCRALVFHA